MSEFQQSEDDDNIILAAFEKTGDRCLPVVKNYLWGQRCEGIKSKKLIMMLGKIKGKAPAHLLEEILLEFPDKTDLVLPALLKNEIKGKGNEHLYKKAIREKLEAASKIIFSLKHFDQPGRKDAVLEKALELELVTLRNNCLDLFSFLYDCDRF